MTKYGSKASLKKLEDTRLTDYLTEQEQIDLLKNWIKQYGPVILAGILAAVILVTGWRYWQDRRARILSHASSVYDEMLTMRARNDPAATLVQAKKLFTHYSHTTYGQMAAFMLARDAINYKNYKEAEKQLNWVLDHSNSSPIRQIARIRLARVLIAEKKPADSIKLLQTVDDKYFNGLIDEIKGDAYLALNKVDMAKKSYQYAITELPNHDNIRPLLQMKYDNLSTAK